MPRLNVEQDIFLLDRIIIRSISFEERAERCYYRNSVRVSSFINNNQYVSACGGVKRFFKRQDRRCLTLLISDTTLDVQKRDALRGVTAASLSSQMRVEWHACPAAATHGGRGGGGRRRRERGKKDSKRGFKGRPAKPFISETSKLNIGFRETRETRFTGPLLSRADN